MDDETKARLARKGLSAAELLEPGKIGESVKGKTKDLAGRAALRGVAAVGRLTGKSKEPPPTPYGDVDVSADFEAWDAAEKQAFDQRLASSIAESSTEVSPKVTAAASRPSNGQARRSLAELKRSFPDDAQEFATVIFHCVDLLSSLSSDDRSPNLSAQDREKRERVLVQLSELLAPNASDALRKFVAHIVHLSEEQR